MRIGLIDVDSKIANLALMKISAWHKQRGDDVEWYSIFERYDIVYMSKVFTFTPDFDQYVANAKEIRKGGTGYGVDNKLPEEIDMMQPDYTIYPSWPQDTALGFLTRGCPNRCKWCIVPKKEGRIAPYMTIGQVTQGFKYKKAVLMDNNILGAGQYAIDQLTEIADRRIRIDFNQAMDARLVTEDIAKILGRIKWLNVMRFGCDTPAQIKDCERVIELVRKYGYHDHILLYTIIQGSMEECYNRISHWRSFHNIRCQSQPCLNLTGKTIIPQWQKDMARWSNQRMLWASCDFKEYQPRKGFTCNQYFN